MVVFLSSLRKLRTVGAALLLFAALSACEPGAINTGPSVNTRDTVRVALLVPQSSGENGVFLSRSLENAARLAISDLEGVEIALTVHDTGGDPALATQAAREALDAGAQIIIGPVFAEAANAAGVEAARGNVNVLSFSNNTAIAGGNVFVLGTTFRNTADRLVGYAMGQGRGNVYIVNAEDTSEEIGRDAIISAIQTNGATYAGNSSFELSQEGVISAVPTIANEVQLSGATSVFLTSGTSGALPFLADLLPEAGLDPAATQMIGLQRLDIPASALSLTGLQSAWFALPDPGLANQFASRYTQTYDSQPHPLAGLAYDGIAAIGALIATGDSNALTTGSLTRGGGFVGANGVFRLLPDGSNERGLAVAQVQNNQVNVIDPAPRSFSGSGF
ncbi:MAG: penicillin-binding protein activator [Rhodobacteraceae bacterium]|nr:penicillin-binding protein activator [Paracoccaceae bacterium]